MDRLAESAKKARKHSYSPYSGFKVGVALRASSGRVYLGTNIENCSYGLTICAERVALYKALSEGERNFDALAIYTEADSLTPPCGACRQTLFEFSTKLPIVLANPKGQEWVNLEDLYPTPFRKGAF